MLKSPDGTSAMIDVHPRKCGAVIGSRGAVIHSMQERSGARIKLNQDFPDGEMRKLTITGSQEQVQMCAELVRRVLEPGGGSHSIHENAMSGGEVITEVIMCPPNLVGRVVGRGGGNVREVQSRSGARVQVNQQFPDGQDRQVEITGTQAAVKAAAELVHYIMENGPVLPAPGMPLVAGGGGHYGGGPGGPGVATAGLAPGTAAVTVECPKSCIGRVIGRGGDTVSRIQRETQAKVHIDQNVPEGAPVKVNISGYEPAVHAAIKLVQDIMVNGSAGFGGGGGGGGGGGYGGGYGQQPHVGAYGGGGRGGVGGGGGYGGHAPNTYGPGGGSGRGGGGQYGGGGSYGGQGGGGHIGGFSSGGGGAPSRGDPPGILPPGWAEYKDQNGTPYYHNATSGVTQWERPL